MERCREQLNPSGGITPLTPVTATKLSPVLPITSKDELENIFIPRKKTTASLPLEEKSDNSGKQPPQKKMKRPVAKLAIRFTAEQILESKKKKMKSQLVQKKPTCKHDFGGD